ncbi:MAG: cytochrome-c oxidase [Ignavibacteria bacterium]|jgi:cytochrome c oxidase subunit 4|nr:cytochrome-c oxidase [Ignavibacteria bacterium]MCU7503927.1 cytochrome-c oxidase [Ignavibacteria bacterium]MCU7515852.1 cytochrome-c oxidase [Ignavibacteria bacterium]
MATDGTHNDSHPHIVNYGTYVLIWLALLALTAATVAVAGINFGGVTLWLAILIASAKATLVLNVFMHIKFDDVVFKVFIAIAIMTLLAVFIFTFADYIFR